MGESLTDAQLAEFVCPDDVELGLKAIAAMTPQRRATIERMAQLEGEIMLWQAGVGKKPEGVILCGRKEIRGAR